MDIHCRPETDVLLRECSQMLRWCWEAVCSACAVGAAGGQLLEPCSQAVTPTYSYTPHLSVSLGFPPTNTFQPVSNFRGCLSSDVPFSLPLRVCSPCTCFASSPVGLKERGGCVCTRCTQQPPPSCSAGVRTDALVHSDQTFGGGLPL